MNCIKNIQKNKLIKKSLFFLKKGLDKIKNCAKIVNHMRREQTRKQKTKK